jgi:hypothetical protein
MSDRADAGGKGHTHRVTGDIGPRTLESPPLLVFQDAGDWTIRASVDGQPFVLERTVGTGAVVLVADALFLRNAWLDRADAAPLAVDLVHAYGVPQFDERGLGTAADESAGRYLVTSSALPVFVGLAVTGLLFAWGGALVPARRIHDIASEAPRLDTFVDAVARLYARTGDHARVLERYRALTAGRLRRRFGLPPDTPIATLLHRLARDPRPDPDGLRLLAEGAAPASERALRRATRALDDLAGSVGA